MNLYVDAVAGLDLITQTVHISSLCDNDQTRFAFKLSTRTTHKTIFENTNIVNLENIRMSRRVNRAACSFARSYSEQAAH